MKIYRFNLKSKAFNVYKHIFLLVLFLLYKLSSTTYISGCNTYIIMLTKRYYLYTCPTTVICICAWIQVFVCMPEYKFCIRAWLELFLYLSNYVFLHTCLTTVICICVWLMVFVYVLDYSYLYTCLTIDFCTRARLRL